MSIDADRNWIKSLFLKIGSLALIAIGFIFFNVMGVIGGLTGESMVKSHFEDSRKEQSIQTMTEVLDELREQLPMAVDEVTTLEVVNLEDMTIVYEYKVDLEDFEASQIQEIAYASRKENTQALCSDPESKKVFDFGFKYRYIYYETDYGGIPSFEITKAICDSL